MIFHVKIVKYTFQCGEDTWRYWDSAWMMCHTRKTVCTSRCRDAYTTECVFKCFQVVKHVIYINHAGSSVGVSVRFYCHGPASTDHRCGMPRFSVCAGGHWCTCAADVGFHWTHCITVHNFLLAPKIEGWKVAYGYGSIPIDTIFNGMDIHKSQLFWCELEGYKVLTHCPMSVRVATQNVNGGRVSAWRQSFVETAGGFVKMPRWCLWIGTEWFTLQNKRIVHQLVGGLEHDFYEFPYIGNNHPNWRTHIFQRGRYTTNQSVAFGTGTGIHRN